MDDEYAFIIASWTISSSLFLKMDIFRWSIKLISTKFKPANSWGVAYICEDKAIPNVLFNSWSLGKKRSPLRDTNNTYGLQQALLVHYILFLVSLTIWNHTTLYLFTIYVTLCQQDLNLVARRSLHCQVEHHVRDKNLLFLSCITKMDKTFINLFSRVDIQNIYYILRIHNQMLWSIF